MKSFDYVVIIFALMVAITVVISCVGLIWAKVTHPELDVRVLTELFGNVITTVVGALVGFVGGRAQGRAETNGNGHIK